MTQEQALERYNSLTYDQKESANMQVKSNQTEHSYLEKWLAGTDMMKAELENPNIMDNELKFIISAINFAAIN